MTAKHGNLCRGRRVFCRKNLKYAVPLKKLTWDRLLVLTGEKWDPGKNVPFDPEAAKKARENAERHGVKIRLPTRKERDKFAEEFLKEKGFSLH